MTMTAPLRARPQPRVAPAATPARRPTLRLVQSPVRQRAGRAGFAVLIAAILLGGLMALLLLHTLAAQDGFAVDRLSTRLSALQDQEQQQSVAVDQLRAPSALAARARALGMRPSVVTSYQRLKDGRMVAVAKPQALPTSPAPLTSPTAAASTTTHQTPTTRSKAGAAAKKRP